MEIPASKGCPSQSNRDSDRSFRTSPGDDLKFAASDMCNFGTVGSSPRGHTYWGEQMSGVPNSHNYSLSRKGTFQSPSHREEETGRPGQNSSVGKHRSKVGPPVSCCWGELKMENPATNNGSKATQDLNQGAEKLGDLDAENDTPDREETSNDRQSHYNNGNFKSSGSNVVIDGPMEEEDSDVLAMFHAVANSRLAVQSQQKDEPDFTPAQKLEILRNLYHTKPLIFLERFRTVLREEHLPCFRHLSGNYEADFYCAEVRKANLGKTLHTRVRNKRYAALQQLIRGGEYFSDEQMRGRDPLLYEQYIGQYLSDEELQELGHCNLEASCSLSGILLDSYQEKVIQQRLLIQQEQEEACQEEEEEDSDQESKDQDIDPDADEWVPDVEEKAFLREEFTSRMYQRFLEGKDLDFDYSEVDENPEFDNLDIVSRDEEERYFDGEEPEAADGMETEETGTKTLAPGM
ncbi:coiled-coil domain-containing protein 97 [Ahaetulla prasina]|uniref:coiled-coil domain-containing protein 97 n=1 Tax=Ahaetulla prasina TaxID=499056 RepID=UPI00264A1967|nr:coiled-coil domain-containing protein 97 [Ahaetulla prasina]